jgi:hypothetical protein
MAYNPSEYEAKRRAYTSSYGAQGAMNAYSRFLSQQRGARQRGAMQRQYEQATPRLVSAYSRRGLLGPNVKSGIFQRGMQDYARDRARTMSEFEQGLSEEQRQFDLQDAQALESFRQQLADLEAEKAQQIASAARQLYEMRVGALNG